MDFVWSFLLMLNVICVLSVENNARVKYDETWVDKLYNSVKRNIDKPFKFFCFSNITTKYITVPFVLKSPKYWNKIEIFRPNIFSQDDTNLYIDLDVVICNKIDTFLNSLDAKDFHMCLEPYQGISNSSIMYWSGDYSFLYDEYKKNPIKYQKEYTTTKRYGDQSFISERVKHKLIDGKFVSWRHHRVETEIKEDSSFLIFTSPHQKPSSSTHLDIVKRNWK